MRNHLKQSFFLITILAVTFRSGAVSTCEDKAFTGFDGRLTVTPLGQFPIKGDVVVGFEVVNGRPIIAVTHRVMALSPSGVATWTSLDKILHIGVDGSGRLIIQTTRAILKPNSGKSVAPVEILTKAVKGGMFDSGNDNLLSVTKDDSGAWKISAIRPDATEGPSLRLQDQVSALSWNSGGLSFVAGSALMIQPKASPRPIFVASDKGFERAQDSCLVGGDRVVLALPDTLFLFTRETAEILVGMAARVRCSGETLYLFDLRTGMTAKVTGLEKVGHKASDEAYAEDLAKRLPPDTPESDPGFLEAARIIGCTSVRALRVNHHR